MRELDLPVEDAVRVLLLRSESPACRSMGAMSSAEDATIFEDVARETYELRRNGAA